MNLNINQLFLYFSILELTAGFKCYKCSYATYVENSRQECVNDPDSLNFNDRLECNSTSYCVLEEQYDIGQKLVTSFFRSCAGKPYGMHCQQDYTHVTCYSSCQGDFCNRDLKGDLSTEFLSKHHGNGYHWNGGQRLAACNVILTTLSVLLGAWFCHRMLHS